MSWVSTFFLVALCAILLLNFGSAVEDSVFSEIDDGAPARSALESAESASASKPLTWDQFYTDDKRLDQTAIVTVFVNSSRFCGPSVGGLNQGQCYIRLSSVISSIAGVKADNPKASGCVPSGAMSFLSLLNISTPLGNASLLSVTFLASNDSTTGCLDILAPRSSVQIATAFAQNLSTALATSDRLVYYSKTANDSFVFFQTILPVPNPQALTSTAQVFTDASDSGGIDFLALGLGLGFGMGCLLLCCLCLLAPIIVPIAIGILLVVIVILALPVIVVLCVVAIVLLVVVVGAILIVVGGIMLLVGFILKKTVYKKRMLAAQEAAEAGEGEDDFGIANFGDEDL